MKFELLMYNLTNSYSILDFQLNEKYFTIKHCSSYKKIFNIKQLDHLKVANSNQVVGMEIPC